MHADTEAWISTVEGDYIGASALAKNRSKTISHLTSFAAHQSAEEYLKAFLVEHNVVFPKTHDLAKELLPRCPNIDESFSVLEPHLEFLDPYAVQSRYPGVDAAGKSLLEFDLSWPPGLVKPRFKWTVQTQERVPPLAGNGLHPVILLSTRSLRTEVDIY